MSLNKTYFESLSNYPPGYNFYDHGSSPTLLKGLIDFLTLHQDNIEKLSLSWYLFNNSILHNALKEVSKSIGSIDVITIPLEGYDADKPMDIKSLETGKVLYSNKTKRDLALPIFSEHYKKLVPRNYNLYVFPHVYVRSENIRPFSRGEMPYSLHAKCGYIQFKDGTVYAVISSSNLAVRDLVKEENLSIIELDADASIELANFFRDLIKESVHITNFKAELNVRNTTFQWQPFKVSDNCMPIAPFYYNSGFIVEDFLRKKIAGAKKRIWVVAQHLAAMTYNVPYAFHTKHSEIGSPRDSILKFIADRVNDLELKFISQTFVPARTDKRDYRDNRKPLNTTNFQQFSDYLINKNVEYYVNANVHSKFIIVDDEVIITTYNYTPTSFIFLDDVRIAQFTNMPDIENFECVYSEVGMSISTTSKETLSAYVDYFNQVVAKPDTKHIYPYNVS